MLGLLEIQNPTVYASSPFHRIKHILGHYCVVLNLVLCNHENFNFFFFLKKAKF